MGGAQPVEVADRRAGEAGERRKGTLPLETCERLANNKPAAPQASRRRRRHEERLEQPEARKRCEFVDKRVN